VGVPEGDIDGRHGVDPGGVGGYRGEGIVGQHRVAAETAVGREYTASRHRRLDRDRLTSTAYTGFDYSSRARIITPQFELRYTVADMLPDDNGPQRFIGPGRPFRLFFGELSGMMRKQRR
jgi:hypothetical protein